MLQGVHEHVVVEHGFVISFILLLHLIKEQILLHEGIVEFGVGIAELMVVDKQLEALGESRLASMILGKGRHQLGMLHDESGILALAFEEVANQLVDESGGVSWSLAIDMEFVADAIKEFPSFFGGDVLREWFTNLCFELFHHGNPTPWWREINLKDLIWMLNSFGVMLDDVASSDILDHLRQHIFGKLEQIVKISIGHVELTASVFGVVGLVNTLVSEVLADFVDSIQSTNDELLEVQFGGYTHVQLHLEIIVVSGKWPCSSTTGNHVHHWSLDLQKLKIIKVLSHELDNLGTSVEYLTGSVVENQIEETFAIPNLIVLNTNVHFREHVQTW